MSSGGFRASMDAMTGGPARRRRRMLRRLEELDRLDLSSRSPQVVLWPGGASPRHDPRAWAPTPPGRYQRTGPRLSRGRRWGAVVIAVVVAVTIAGQSHILHLLPARAERPAGALVPPRSDEASDERQLPAVIIDDVPRPDTFAWIQAQTNGHEPVTFDPCRPVHYITRSTGPATDDSSLVHEAVETVSRASGLKFAFDGPTTEKPSQGREPFQPNRYGDRWAPVLVAWTDATESQELAGKAGLGGGIPWRDPHGRLTYVSGTAWLDTPSLRPMLQSRDGRRDVVAIIVHELSHVLGAAHAPASNQLMSEGGAGRTALGDGDRYALSVLGRGQCVPGL